MFLRSCASVFRQCVKTAPRPLLSRATHTTSRLYCTDKKDSEVFIVDYSKSVNIVLKKPDGSIRKEVAKVGETIYDLVKRIDKEHTDFPGFGACRACTSCTTCHVILEEKYFELDEPKIELEEDLLCLAPGVEDFSRLGCCFPITKEMDGMVVRFPSELATFYVEEEKSIGS